MLSANNQRICLVSWKQNRQICLSYIYMKVYLSPSCKSHKGKSQFICTARITGSLDNVLWSYQTELKIYPQGIKIAFCTFFSCLMAIKKKNPCTWRSILLHYAVTVNSPHWEKHYLKINFTAGIEKRMKNNHSVQGIMAEWRAWFREVPNLKDCTVHQKKTLPFYMFKKCYTANIQIWINSHC